MLLVDSDVIPTGRDVAPVHSNVMSVDSDVFDVSHACALGNMLVQMPAELEASTANKAMLSFMLSCKIVLLVGLSVRILEIAGQTSAFTAGQKLLG
jgi:hypothetical protein